MDFAGRAVLAAVCCRGLHQGDLIGLVEPNSRADLSPTSSPVTRNSVFLFCCRARDVLLGAKNRDLRGGRANIVTNCLQICADRSRWIWPYSDHVHPNDHQEVQGAPTICSSNRCIPARGPGRRSSVHSETSSPERKKNGSSWPERWRPSLRIKSRSSTSRIRKPRPSFAKSERRRPRKEKENNQTVVGTGRAI